MRERELTICEFNVENLFISAAYYEGQLPKARALVARLRGQ